MNTPEKKPRKRWNSEAEIFKAIDRKKLLEQKHIACGLECEKGKEYLLKYGRRQEAALEEDKARRHYRRAELMKGQLKTLQRKLAEFRTELLPGIGDDRSVMR